MNTSKKEDFFKQLNLSETTTRNYKVAFNSGFLKAVLLEECGIEDLFKVIDLELLWKVYSKINLHPKNVANHRIYSAAVMKYMKYLNNGVRYGRRIDYKKHKTTTKKRTTC